MASAEWGYKFQRAGGNAEMFKHLIEIDFTARIGQTNANAVIEALQSVDIHRNEYDAEWVFVLRFDKAICLQIHVSDAHNIQSVSQVRDVLFCHIKKIPDEDVMRLAFVFG